MSEVLVGGKAINYGALPETLRDGIKSWIEDGIPPESFLRAVLENDLYRAYAYGDRESLSQMGAICNWFRWSAPVGCCGSRETCKEWAMRHDRIWT